jgi:hypothetical protein
MAGGTGNGKSLEGDLPNRCHGVSSVAALQENAAALAALDEESDDEARALEVIEDGLLDEA